MNLAGIASTAEIHNISTIPKAENEQEFSDETNVGERNEDEIDICLSGVQVLYFVCCMAGYILGNRPPHFIEE